MRFISFVLIALIVLVHAELWFGSSGVSRMMALQAKLEQQKAVNDEARRRNEQLAAEVSDLAEGLEMVEEKARYDLGMVKRDEILVQMSAAAK